MKRIEHERNNRFVDNPVPESVRIGESHTESLDRTCYRKSCSQYLLTPKKIYITLILMLCLFLGGSTVFGQISILNAWTNLYHGTSTTTRNITYSIPVGSSANRVLVVAIASSRTTVGSRTVTLTYGSQTLTSVNGDMASTIPRQHTQLYYLNEAGLDAATSTTLSVTVSGGTTRITDVFATVFDNVDQASLLTDSQNYSSGTSNTNTAVFATALIVNANDQAVEIISSLRSGNTTPRTITYATNWSMVTQQTWTTTDGVRNAVANRSIPTSNTTDVSSTGFSGTCLASMTGMSIKYYVPKYFRSVINGNWNSTSTWEESYDNSTWGAATTIPSRSDNLVTIQSGTTVTLMVAATVSSITVDGILDVSTFGLTGSGTMTISSTGSLLIGGASNFPTGFSITTLSSGSTVNYDRNGTQTVTAISYSNLTLAGTSAKTTTGATVTGILSIEGTASITGTAPSWSGTSYTLQYKTTDTHTAGTEWITPFAGSGGVIIANTTGSVTLNNAKVFNPSVPLTINSGATLNTSATNNYQLTFGGDFVNNGGTFTANASPIVIGPGTATQSIDGFTTTGTVSMTKSGGTATFQGNVNGAGLTINGIGGGILNLGTGLSHTFTGVVTLTAGTLDGGSSTLHENMISTTAWNGNGTVFSAGTGTVDFGAAGNQTLSASATTFNDLTFSTTGMKTLGSATTINGNLSLSGTIANLGTFTSSSATLSLGGNGQPSGSWGGTGSGATYINTSYFAAATGILNVSSSSCATGTWIGGTSTDWNTGSNWCGGSVPTASTNVVIPSGGNQPSISAAAVCNDITINPGATLTITGSNTLSVSGHWTKNGTFTANSSTVNFNGTAQTISGSSGTTFNNLTLSVSGLKTLTTVPTVNGVFSMEGTATVSSAPTYGAAAALQYNTSISRTAGVEWITPFAATGGVIIASTGTITLNAAKVFNASVPLTLNSGSALNTSASNYQVTFGGNFVNIGGTFTANASPVVIGPGTATQSIAGFTTTGAVSMTKTGGIATFTGNLNGAGLTINGTGGTLNLGTALTHTFTGDITLNAGTLNGGSSILNENATSVTAWNGTGTVFTAGTGTVNFGGAAQTLSATSTTFNNLTFSGSGTKILSTATIANGILTINGVTLATANNALTLGGDFVNSGGIFTPGSSNITISGTSTQSIAGFTTTGTVSMTKTGGTATLQGNVGGAGLTINGSGGTLNLGTALTHTFTSVVTLTAGTLNGGSSTLNENAVSTTAWNGNGTLFSAGSGTVNFGAAGNQTLSASATTFNNLTFSNIGTKILGSATTINGGLSISGAAIANLGTFTSSSTTLTLGGIGQSSGSWGGTTSGATHINTTYFAAATGILNVSTGSCISSQPSNATICSGAGTTFSVTASGSPTYQWQVSTNGGGAWTNITAAGAEPGYAGWTTATLTLTGTVPSNNAYQYHCVLSGGCAQTSNAGILTLQIINITYTLSASPGLVDISGSSILTLSGSQTNVDYQLREGSTPLGSPVAGTGSAISFAAVNPTTSTQYNVIATTSTGGCSAPITDTKTVIVNETGIIIDLTTCNGQPGVNFFTNSDFKTIYTNNYQTPDQGLFPGVILGYPLGAYTNYTYGFVSNAIPDGNYVIANSTAGMYRTPQQVMGRDVWLYTEDRSSTPGIGDMYIVNASNTPGVFYTETLTNLCENTRYEFRAEMINLYDANWVPHGPDYLNYFPKDGQGTYYSILPNVDFMLDGKVALNTGNIMNDGTWKTFGFTFRTAAGQDSITLTMRNNSTGGIGNDIALDNILMRACGPEISLVINTTLPVCPGVPVTMTADLIASDYLTPEYQWQKSTDNGMTWNNISGANDSTYTSPNPAYGDEFRFIVAETTASLSNPNCSVASNPVSITTTAGITGTTPGSVCGTGTVTLGATATSGSTIDWYANLTGGSSLGTGTSYTTPTISSTTTYYVEATNAGCVSNPRTSVVATVNTSVPVSVSISASTGNSICSGTNVTFTATPTNGGATPSYQWKLNGGNVGTNSNTYSNNTLANGNTVSCVMTSSLSSCITGSPATSNTITMTVGTSMPASVSISANPGNTICQGTSVTFTATPTNGGATPNYQWKKNTIDIYGEVSNTYTTTTLAQGDVITCVMTTSLPCATGSPATSNTVTMAVDAIPASPTLSSVTPASSSVICADYNSGTATFTGGSGGGSNEYQFSIDGGSTWSAYTNGAAITTTGGTTSVQVRARRSGGACSASSYNTYTIWTYGSTPTASALSSASPTNGSTICAGYNTGTVTGSFGSGGSTGAADEYQYSINGGSTYNAYTNGAAITTTGATTSVIVQARRTGGSYGCTNSSWSTICTWTVSTATVNPTLNVATPVSGTAICTGYNGPDATITAGSGGSSGAADLYEYSLNNGGAWLTYTSGTTINTAGAITNVLIRVSRSGGSYGCSGTGPTTIVTWPVSPLTVGGTVASDQTICSGTSPADLTLSGNTGTVVKWQKSSDLAFTSPTDIAVTSTTLSGAIIGNLTVNTYFRAVVQSGACSQANSASVLITITPNPDLAGLATSATDVCTGNVSVVTLSATSLPNGSYTVNYTLTGANAQGATNVAMIVSSGNSGTFNTPSLNSAGITNLTINSLTLNSCTTAAISGNTATIVASETGTWIGITSTDWNTGSNWCGGIPTSSTDVVIPSTAPNQPIIGAAGGLCHNITISSGASLTISGSNSLSVSGNFTNNGGTFDSGTGTVTFNGSGNQAINGTVASQTFYNVIINKSSNILSVGGSTTSLTIHDLTETSGDFTAPNSLGITGNLTLTAGTFTAGPTITITGNWTNNSGAFTPGSGSVTFNGSGSQAIGGTSSTIFNNLALNNAAGAILAQSQTVNGTLTLTSGILTVGANTLTIAGNSPVRTSGTIDAGNAGSTLAFTNTGAITLPASIFTGAVNNMTINGTGGVTASSDFTVNGILHLQSANPSTSKGSLDMGSSSVLTMGSSATTTGAGDVTGIVKRTTFVAATSYTFGNQYTTMAFQSGGTIPTDISVKIAIGLAPGWKTGAVQRTYDIVRTGGSGYATINLHYLETELNGNTENTLVQWDASLPSPPGVVEEHGRSNYDLTNDWVGITGLPISYLPTTFASDVWTLGNTLQTGFTWNGSVSTDWMIPENWTPGGVPTDLSNAIIPDASTTPRDPTLIDGQAVLVRTLTIESGGIVNAATDATITLFGASDAWSNNGGTFNPSTSTVIFTNAAASISGSTNFYNVTINSGAGLTLGSGSTMRISGTMTNNGTWQAAMLANNTVEYNGGNQTVLNPNGSTPGYDNLVLSGTGTKTMPGSALDISGDFTLSGSATATPTNTVTVSGATTLRGTSLLTLGAANILSNSGAIILDGGTFRTGATTGFSETAGTLNLSDNSTIALGTGAHSLIFDASSGISWTSGKVLTITGWTGAWDGTTGTAGKIFVGANASGLTADQVAQIRFYDGTSYFPAIILPSGEVVPTHTSPSDYFRSVSTGNWSTATNWQSSPDNSTWSTATLAPTNTATLITLQNPYTITVDVNNQTASSIVMEGGSILSNGSNTLLVSGDWTHNGGTITSGSGAINFNGSGVQTIAGTASTTFDNLTLDNSAGATLAQSQTINGTLTLTAGTLTIGANTLTIAGNSPSRTCGAIDASNASATLAFTNSGAITLPASIFTGAVNNLTINGAGGVTANNNFTVNGILYLQSANPSASTGSLDMSSGSVLTMGGSATTTGAGDVTGIVKRTTFVAATSYTFGSKYTTITFQSGGTLPTDISMKIVIGSAPAWKTDAILRNYDIMRTGGSGNILTLNLHYLDSELNTNPETDLTFWDYLTGIQEIDAHAKTDSSTSNNWIGISNIDISYFPTAFDDHIWTLSKEIYALFEGIRGWRMISSPTANNYANLLNGFITQGAAGSSYPIKQPNCLWFDETDTLTTNMSWRTMANLTNSITPGRGHFFYVFDSVSGAYNDTLPRRMSAGGNSNFTTGTFTFSGGNQPVTFTHRAGGQTQVPGDTLFYDTNISDEGWNLLGNPTYSTLDWDAPMGWIKTNLDNTIYIWDPGANAGNGEYKVWNGTSGALHNGLIAPYQAFWVHANASSPGLSFTDDVLTSGGTFYGGGIIIKSLQADSGPNAIDLSLNAGGLESTAIISFMADAKVGPDNLDAYRLEPPSDSWLELFTLSSPSHIMPLVINNLPVDKPDFLDLPLFVGGQQRGQTLGGRYSLHWQLPPDWPVDWAISLNDHQSEKAISMRRYQDYDFDIYNTKSGEVTSDSLNFPMLPASIINPVSQKSRFKSSTQLPPFSIIIQKGVYGDDPIYVAPQAELLQNYPNPFNYYTTLRFSLPLPAYVTLKIYGIHGELIDVVADRNFEAGIHNIPWNNINVKPGIYLLQMHADDVVKTKKLVITTK